MSDAPIWVDEGVDPGVLERAGWTNAELIWEQIQTAAAECARRGDHEEAAELWAGGLEVAREHLSDDDPRRAASLANHGVARGRAGGKAESRRLLAAALIGWDDGERWVRALTPETRARSSTFHLRLESKHRGGYQRFSRARHNELWELGRAAIVAHLSGETPAEGGYARWQRERPAGFNDLRKLMAAALLITP